MEAGPLHETALAITAILGPVLGGAATAGGAWLAWRLRKSSAPLALGDSVRGLAPLEGPDGRRHRLSDFGNARVLVLVFMSNRCPGVKAYDQRLIQLQERHRASGVAVVGINPIDDHLYPTEGRAEMAVAARERGLNFPYLKDPTQDVARHLGARCTPHVFILDADRRLRYRGRVDDAFVAARATRSYLEDAVEDLLAGREVRVPETPPLGCSIDWKAGPGGTPRSARAQGATSSP